MSVPPSSRRSPSEAGRPLGRQWAFLRRPSRCPDPLVGRERELREVRDLLRRPETRLLTLTGVRGGRQDAPRHPGRTRCRRPLPGRGSVRRLALLNDSELVVPTIARSLGMREAVGQTPREALHAHLRDKRMLWCSTTSSTCWRRRPRCPS
jgi:hypothetical protein